MNKTDLVEKPRLRKVPGFRAGDTLRVHVRVVEGNRERTQVFQGVVIRRKGGGLRETFTVRKVSFGVGVERTFPVHSPTIGKIEIVSRGDVRRAKLYYLRELRGKKARIKELRGAAAEALAVEEEEEVVPELAEGEEPAAEPEPDAEAEPAEPEGGADEGQAEGDEPADEQPDQAPAEEPEAKADEGPGDGDAEDEDAS